MWEREFTGAGGKRFAEYEVGTWPDLGYKVRGIESWACLGVYIKSNPDLKDTGTVHERTAKQVGHGIPGHTWLQMLEVLNGYKEREQCHI